MDELRELYQEIILDHNKDPRNFKELASATHTSEGYNPLCGDKINLFLEVDDDKIKDIGFQGSGCAISKASASIMTDLIKGKSKQEITILFEKFQDLVTSEISKNFDMMELGKLAVFAGVREFPTRVKCASLAWHTMLAALGNNNRTTITTE